MLCKFKAESTYANEIALWHRCSPLNLLHIFKTHFAKNTCGGQLLEDVSEAFITFSEPVQNFRKIFIDDSSGFTQDTLHSRVLTSPLHRRWFYKPNNLVKYQYFYTRDFISLLHLKKNGTLHGNVFRNIHFLPHFHYFQKWVRYVIFQVNADFLINQLTKHFYTRHLTPLLHLKKKIALSSEECFRNIYFSPHFHHIFTRFSTQRWGVNITNKNQPPSNLAKHKYFYTRDLLSFRHLRKK